MLKKQRDEYFTIGFHQYGENPEADEPLYLVANQVNNADLGVKIRFSKSQIEAFEDTFYDMDELGDQFSPNVLNNVIILRSDNDENYALTLTKISSKSYAVDSWFKNEISEEDKFFNNVKFNSLTKTKNGFQEAMRIAWDKYKYKQ